MKITIATTLLSTAAAFVPSSTTTSTSSSSLCETKADLSTLAKSLNPIVPFFDPLGLADQEFWGQSNEATIGFLRESEVKHGRIAMFAFVGYIVHANHITWPWPMQLDGTMFPSDYASPPEAWDMIPDGAKLQIFAFIGFLEYWREVAADKHYMRGGKVGEFPAFDATYIPGGALNLYDPFGFSSSKTEEQKAKGLVKEINNGRAAMLGIFGFLCAQTIPGSVPGLEDITHLPAYSGEVMAPFSQSILPSL